IRRGFGNTTETAVMQIGCVCGRNNLAAIPPGFDGSSTMVQFTTNTAVDFSKDLDPFFTLFANTEHYPSHTPTSLDVTGAGLFPRTLHVGGQFPLAGADEVATGTIASMTMDLPLGVGSYVFTGMSIDEYTLYEEFFSFGTAYGLGHMLSGDDLIIG